MATRFVITPIGDVTRLQTPMDTGITATLGARGITVSHDLPIYKFIRL